MAWLSHANFFSAGGNIFGGSTPSVGSTTGGGAFSSGLGQSIIQSGFGTPAAFQSKPGILVLFSHFRAL
jgi:hypothetical protein